MNNDKELTFEVLSLYGDTWYAGLSLLWFGYGSYRLTRAEANTDDSKITCLHIPRDRGHDSMLMAGSIPL